MVIFALITILSFFSPEPGLVTRVWLRGIRQVLGWWAFIVPLILGAIGVWLILRRFGDRFKIEPIRYIGGAVVVVGAITLTHFFLMLVKPVGLVYVNPSIPYDPSQPIPAEARSACPSNPSALVDQGFTPVNVELSSFEVAACGHGGGLLGAAVQSGLDALLGDWGVFFVSLAAVLIGAMMAAKMTVGDIVEWAGERRKKRAAETEEEEEEEAEPKKKPAPAPAKPAGKPEPAVAGAASPGQSSPARPTPAPAPSGSPAPASSPAPALSGRPGATPPPPGGAAPTPSPTPPGAPSGAPAGEAPGPLRVPPRPGTATGTPAPSSSSPPSPRPGLGGSPPGQGGTQGARNQTSGPPVSRIGTASPARPGPRPPDRPDSTPPGGAPEPSPRQPSFGEPRPAPKPQNPLAARLEELGDEEVDADDVIRELVAEEKPEPRNAAPATSGPEVPARPAPSTAVAPRGEAGNRALEREWPLPDFRTVLEVTTEQTIGETELRRRAEIIEQTLASFGAPGRVVEINHGPVITQFGVEPDYNDWRAGQRIKVKVGKISSLADDLALALEAPSIRVEAPVPGKGYVGIEVPNKEASIVGLRDVMDTQEFQGLGSPLRLALGQNVSGSPVVADLTGMPHLLIAGTTGSGKSVCINGIISTLLLTCSPDRLKMIMVDPKRVELTNYNGIPHLMSPVVVELERIVGVLKWVQHEMDGRYRKFALAGARNIVDYNQRVAKGRVNDEPLPYILVIVDELADLMMLAPDETERLVTRLAQMARATGIHIVISTQRPSVDVVTGLIKANFPARIAFAVATGVDSRVILDMPGAEKLLGRGDMLFQAPDSPLPARLQGVFVSDQEIQRLVAYWRDQAAKHPEWLKEPQERFDSNHVTARSSSERLPSNGGEDEGSDGDALYGEAVELVREMGKASISLLQRHLRIGYTRAARLIDMMEENGIVSEHEGGSKPRLVLESEEDEEGVETAVAVAVPMARKPDSGAESDADESDEEDADGEDEESEDADEEAPEDSKTE
jgi:hypothetical protein